MFWSASILRYAVVLVAFVYVVGDTDFTNDWAVHVPGGEVEARMVAEEHGYVFHGQIGSLENYFLFKHSDVPSRSKRSSHQHTKRLIDDNRIHWVEQQFGRDRVKRDFIIRDEGNSDNLYNDPMWSGQWYLHDKRQSTDSPKLDLHVLPVWKKGITGEGIVVTVLDDGFETDHPDLTKNYDKDACYDFNSNDANPYPRYNNPNNEENKHGTRCIGEIAMEENNNICGVGVAHGAKIGGSPDLTWRDVQHIIVWTSEPAPLEVPEANEPTFKTNKIGLKVDEVFGFGLLNTDAMIKLG
uniref:Neuroendocrine convertase 1-like n=1 Tax=Saccoglossus kowalevskii TaxID=10224 RepID=A0ABM0MGW7_SACKO|nr:PREDICTED: neuroendocrine convertase 1-like [Saccoglossus kowalevskii]